MWIHFHPDFPVTVTGNADAGNARQLQQAAFYIIPRLIQIGARRIAIQAHADNRETGFQARQFGLLGLLRQVGNLIQPGAQITHKLLGVGAGLELQGYRGQALAGRGCHNIQVRHTIEFILDSERHLALYLLRGSAFKYRCHARHIQIDHWKHLLWHGVPGQDSEQHDQHQAQIGNERIGDGEAD